jgi:hypothetical protein
MRPVPTYTSAPWSPPNPVQAGRSLQVPTTSGHAAIFTALPSTHTSLKCKRLKGRHHHRRDSTVGTEITAVTTAIARHLSEPWCKGSTGSSVCISAARAHRREHKGTTTLTRSPSPQRAISRCSYALDEHLETHIRSWQLSLRLCAESPTGCRS